MISIAGLCLAVAGCGGQPIYVSPDGPPVAGPVALDRVADANVKAEHIGTAGNPASYVVFGRRYHVMRSADGYRERGYASWYGRKFHGRKTSNGEIYDMYKMSAAHKTLPIPSYVRVTNLENNRQAILRVNDRGPFVKGRIIDLSYAAAHKLDMLKNGTAMVEVELVTPESLEAERRAREEPRLVKAVQTEPAGDSVLPEPGDSTEAGLIKAVQTQSAGGATTSAALSTGFGHFLQAGAFRFRDNAQLMEARLRQAGLGNTTIQTLRINDIYRVRLGPYSDQAQLQYDFERLQALGIRPQTISPD